jgi:hypothetical protein
VGSYLGVGEHRGRDALAPMLGRNIDSDNVAVETIAETFEVEEDEAEKLGVGVVGDEKSNCTGSFGEVAHHDAVKLKRLGEADSIEAEHRFNIGWAVPTKSHADLRSSEFLANLVLRCKNTLPA